jgi:hypothetical protein
MPRPLALTPHAAALPAPPCSARKGLQRQAQEEPKRGASGRATQPQGHNMQIFLLQAASQLAGPRCLFLAGSHRTPRRHFRCDVVRHAAGSGHRTTYWFAVCGVRPECPEREFPPSSPPCPRLCAPRTVVYVGLPMPLHHGLANSTSHGAWALGRWLVWGLYGAQVNR